MHCRTIERFAHGSEQRCGARKNWKIRANDEEKRFTWPITADYNNNSFYCCYLLALRLYALFVQLLFARSCAPLVLLLVEWFHAAQQFFSALYCGCTANRSTRHQDEQCKRRSIDTIAFIEIFPPKMKNATNKKKPIQHLQFIQKSI